MEPLGPLIARMRAVLSGILATGDVLDRDEFDRTIVAVAVENWHSDELAVFGTELEDLEPEPNEEDDPAEDGERRGGYPVASHVLRWRVRMRPRPSANGHLWQNGEEGWQVCRLTLPPSNGAFAV
jgi:hypothetical protein